VLTNYYKKLAFCLSWCNIERAGSQCANVQIVIQFPSVPRNIAFLPALKSVCPSDLTSSENKNYTVQMLTMQNILLTPGPFVPNLILDFSGSLCVRLDVNTIPI
jgi:hypothetical protein